MQWNLLFLGAAAVGYLASTVLYEWLLATRAKRCGQWASGLMLVAAALHTLALATRWVEAGRPPLAGRFESFSFYGWLIVLAYLAVERLYRQRMLGAFVSPLALGFLAVALASPKEITPLQPTLQSAWLPIHVGISFAAYTAFTLAFVAAVSYLLQERELRAKRPHAWYYRLPPLATMEGLSHNLAGIGFPCLALAIITGALWAQQAWGHLWEWEAKQTTSLVTLMVYAAYFPTRELLGWRGRRSAWLLVVGFFLVLATFMGVNALAPGQHKF